MSEAINEVAQSIEMKRKKQPLTPQERAQRQIKTLCRSINSTSVKSRRMKERYETLSAWSNDGLNNNTKQRIQALERTIKILAELSETFQCQLK